MSRTLRRLKMKLLQKTTKDIQKNGFSTSDTVLETGAMVNVFSKIIKTHKKNVSVKLSQLGNEILQKSLSRHLNYEKIECAQGCTFCCHSFVSATAPEIFTMLAGINSLENTARSKIIGQIKNQDSKTRNLNINEKTLARIACGLLMEKSCAIYDARPFACRWHHSLSKNACETFFGDPQGVVPIPNEIDTLKARLGVAYLIALEAHKLPHHRYEIHHALVVALETENAEEKWLNGQDIFAEVQIDRDMQTIDNPAFELRLAEIRRASQGDFEA